MRLLIVSIPTGWGWMLQISNYETRERFGSWFVDARRLAGPFVTVQPRSTREEGSNDAQD